jgi:hypothetical protein
MSWMVDSGTFILWIARSIASMGGRPGSFWSCSFSAAVQRYLYAPLRKVSAVLCPYCPFLVISFSMWLRTAVDSISRKHACSAAIWFAALFLSSISNMAIMPLLSILVPSLAMAIMARGVSLPTKSSGELS